VPSRSTAPLRYCRRPQRPRRRFPTWPARWPARWSPNRPKTHDRAVGLQREAWSSPAAILVTPRAQTAPPPQGRAHGQPGVAGVKQSAFAAAPGADNIVLVGPDRDFDVEILLRVPATGRNRFDRKTIVGVGKRRAHGQGGIGRRGAGRREIKQLGRRLQLNSRSPAPFACGEPSKLCR